MKRIFSIILLLIVAHIVSIAQPTPAKGTQLPGNSTTPGVIVGKILEKGSNTPLEYANVTVYLQKDSSLAGGSIANSKGTFTIGSLPVGEYYLEAKFIGYNVSKKEHIVISRSKTSVDLGTIELDPATENISEVKVIAQDKPIAYEIDKKVIDPAQFPTAANGTAVDILANTPSVSVDIEGNVSLRGSTSFTVLIDGRPTPFEPADALAQIPASTIRNIEIITNPSAKYDPDGNAGIININTKKSKMKGISGIINATADTYGSITGDFLLNYRLNKFNFFVSGNRANRYNEGHSESKTMTIDADTTYNTYSSGNNDRGRASYSLKSGFDYYLNEKNTLSFNVDFNGRSGTSSSSLDYGEFNSLGDTTLSYTENKSEQIDNNVAYSLDYKKTFDREGEELTAFLYYENGSGDENSYYDQTDMGQLLIEGQKSWDSSTEKEFRAKADYVYPFSAKSKLEAGVQSRVNRDTEWNDVHWYTVKDNYEPSESSPYYTNATFSRDIHSVYATFSKQKTQWGYQLGLRGEYTDQVIEYSDTSAKYNQFGLFPSAHFSFNLPAQQQATISYTRRIERPRSFYLEPFYTYTDAYSIRTGNPSIKPEYIDSYEMGYQKQLGKGFLSAEAYFRQTNDKIERVQSVYSQNVILNTFANVGTDYSLGIELMLNYKPMKWWTINLMGNIYNYRMKGEYEGDDFDTESNNWNARFNNTFSIRKNTKLQIDGMYNSPTVTAQGRREGFMFTNVAIRQDMLKQKLTATLSVRDVLNTAKFEFTSEGSDFYSYNKFDMKSPVFSITLSYKINNFKQKESKGQNGEDGGNMMDMSGGDM